MEVTIMTRLKYVCFVRVCEYLLHRFINIIFGKIFHIKNSFFYYRTQTSIKLNKR